MISDDLANLSDRIAGCATRGVAPTAAECGHLAAELLKLSHIVARMEGLPFDRTLLQILEPMPEPEWVFRRSWQSWLKGAQT